MQALTRMTNVAVPRFILSFVLTWSLYLVGVAVLPAHSMYGRLAEAVLLQIGFALLTTVAAMVAWRLSDRCARERVPSARGDVFNHARLRRAARTGIALSVVGLFALAVDKVFVQGVDYSLGLAGARYQWAMLGEAREGVSSAWSVLGYLLSTSFFVSIYVVVLHDGVFSAKGKTVVWIASLGLALGNSALSGGRSLLLLLVVVSVALVSLRADLGKSLPQIGGRLVLVGVAAIMALGAYVLYVFAARAELTGFDAHEYAVGMLEFLGAQPMSAFEGMSSNTWVAHLAGLVVLALAYLVHSVFTFAAIIDLPSESSQLLLYVRLLAAKLGFVDYPDLEWELTGRFPSLPGVLYLDGGVGLLAGGAVLLGVWMALSVRLCQRHPTSLVAVSVWLAVHTTALLSPLLLAAELLNYPFVIAEFLLIAVAAGAARFRPRAARRG